MKTENKAVGIWIRVSTDDQAKGESPEHHEARARMYAEMKGWEVVTVYHLEGVSGKVVNDHPETRRMMMDIEKGNITGLIFSKLARLARSTKQLLDFSDFFQEHHADLISLQESIDTSSPAGRLFYTIIAAMAQWEREEIASRVAASVPIRAKMGKPLGGQAPFGYAWVNQKLVINEEEAPIRKLAFELFKEHKKKQVVARTLNEAGYRTRKGAKFSAWTIERHLTDPIAKGMRRMNYTKSLGKNKHWEVKPEEEWIFQPAPAIVSETLWEEVNQILRIQKTKTARPHRGVVNLFAGLVYCQCGTKMYVASKTQKYVCQSCRNKIPKQDLEDIFREQLQAYTISGEHIRSELEKSAQGIALKERLLQTLELKEKELNQEVKSVLKLVSKGEFPEDAFGKFYHPIAEQLKQIEAQIPEIKAEIDFLKAEKLSSDYVLEEAQNLYGRWPTLTFEEKRSIVETVVTRLSVGKDDLEIDLAYLIPSIELVTKASHNYKDSSKPPS